MLEGSLLWLPTIGVYRFWLLSRKRRFYWSHTIVGEDALEYTGSSLQLLAGFFLAQVVFVPVYILLLFFYLQSPGVRFAGYAGVAVLWLFLTGYAQFGVRQFLLTRTIWRGIRFSMDGGALVYAIRRTLWVAVSIGTLGLAYPWQVLSLWRYRYAHTWYGDKKCEFSGRWRQVGPIFHFHQLVWILILAGIFLVASPNFHSGGTPGNRIYQVPPELLWAIIGGGLTYFLASLAHIKAITTSRLLSVVTLGKTRIRVRVATSALLWQYFLFAVVVIIVAILFQKLFYSHLTGLRVPIDFGNHASPLQVSQSGWTYLYLPAVYLAHLASVSVLQELILRFGFWKLVVTGSTIRNHSDLQNVRAMGEESSLGGQGVADGLNVGDY